MSSSDPVYRGSIQSSLLVPIHYYVEAHHLVPADVEKSSTSTLHTSALGASSSTWSVPGSSGGDELGCAALVPIGATASLLEVPPESVAAEVPPLAVDSCTPQ
eukprot:scaffold70854_cov74-Phaeocystis_antarctica.AAC.1